MTRKSKRKARIKKTSAIIIAAAALSAILILSGCFMLLSGNKTGKVILTINSGACHCVKNRCFNMQKEVKDFISEKGYSSSIELKVYDTATGDEAAKIIEKYQMGMPPYIILLNNGEEIKYKANAFEFNKDGLNEAVKTLLQEGVKND